MESSDTGEPQFHVKKIVHAAPGLQGSHVSPAGGTTSLKSSSPSFACATNSFSSSTAPTEPAMKDPNLPKIKSKETMDEYYLGIPMGNSFTNAGILPTPGILPDASACSKKRKKKGQQPHSSDSDDTGQGRRLTEDDTAFLLSLAEEYEQGCEDIMMSLMADQVKKPPKIMELCCEEDSGLTTALEAQGGLGIRCGLFNDCDLNKKSGFNKVIQLLKTYKPDVLWVSLPCGPTSGIQELN